MKMINLKRKIKKDLKFYKESLLFVFFSFYPFISLGLIMPSVCLHPLEEAALFYSNKNDSGSLEKQIEKAEETIESLEEKILGYIEGEGRITGVEELIETLSDSLDENPLYNDFQSADGDSGTKAVAQLISDYISSKQDGLEESERKGLPWEDNHRRYFKSNGRVDEKFCMEFAKKDKNSCKKAIQKLKRVWEQISKIADKIRRIEEDLEVLDEKLFEKSFEDEESSSALCFDCLDELRELDGPTTGQIVGNTLSLLSGAGLSYLGYTAGRSSARNANTLRIQQGHLPISSVGPSFAGASIGLPFISNGIYGLTNGSSQFGNYACSPGAFSGGGAYFGGSPFAGGAFGVGPFGGSPFGVGAFGGSPFGAGPFGVGAFAGGPFGGGAFGGGINPYLQAQQQQYSQYLQFQQQQQQAYLQAQQAWLQQQQAIQQDRIQRQQVISGLYQEIGQIQQQIQSIAYGGGIGVGSLGTSLGAFSTGIQLGNSSLLNQAKAPQVQSPAPTNNYQQRGGNLPPIIDQR